MPKKNKVQSSVSPHRYLECAVTLFQSSKFVSSCSDYKARNSVARVVL